MLRIKHRHNYWASLIFFSILITFLIGLSDIRVASGAGVQGCLDQTIGDISIPGKPVNPTLSEERLFVDLDPIPMFLQLNINDPKYDIFQEEMHNRTITVAISKSFVEEEVRRNEISQFAFDTWAIYWNIFGGFPFDKYTIVFDANLPWSNSGFGTGFDASFTYIDAIAHEMFHAWNWNAIGVDKAKCWWLLEGVTRYYNFRQGTGPGLTGMVWPLDEYRIYLQKYPDIPLSDILDSSPEEHYNFTAHKGCLVAYILDRRLNKDGHHLSEVMRLIYQRYGINSVQPPFPGNPELLSIINEVAGNDYSDFFNDYIYGTKRITLEFDDLEWFCHGETVQAESGSGNSNGLCFITTSNN